MGLPGSKELGNPVKILRDWDRDLQLFPLNEESLVSTARRTWFGLSFKPFMGGLLPRLWLLFPAKLDAVDGA